MSFACKKSTRRKRRTTAEDAFSRSIGCLPAALMRSTCKSDSNHDPFQFSHDCKISCSCGRPCRSASDPTPIYTHAFEFACARNDIDHRLTKPKHPWTNGQVERMNLKDATVKRYFHETHGELTTA